MKPRLLLLIPTSTYRAGAFVRAARRLPIEVSIASEAPNSLSHLHPVDLPTFDFDDPGGAALMARRCFADVAVDAVIGVDDRSALPAAQIAEALGVPHNSPDAVRAALNKALGRDRMRAAGLPVPPHALVPVDGPGRVPDSVGFPAVVKPLAMAASRGVIRVDDAASFAAACARVAPVVRAESPPRDELARTHLLVESYVPGWEVAVEAMVIGGEMHVLTIFDKPDPLEGPYFPETLYVTPSRHGESVQRDIVETTRRAITALGLTHGPVHAELRGNDRGVVPIEVHARSIGGLCSRVLRFEDGRSLEDVIVQHALGLLGPIPRLDPLAAGVWMMPAPRAGRFQSMRGVEKARRIAGVEEVIVSTSAGQTVTPLPEGFLYLGFVFARAETPHRVETALREAMAVLDPVLDEVSEAARA